jgi:hypothetical protein
MKPMGGIDPVGSGTQTSMPGTRLGLPRRRHIDPHPGRSGRYTSSTQDIGGLEAG